MKRPHLYIAIFAAALLTQACTLGYKSQEEIEELTEPEGPKLDVAAAADSMAELELYGTAVTDVLHHKLDTVSDALDFMESSPHREEYASGIIPIIARQHLPYAEKLLQSTFPYFIIVDKQTMTLNLYDRFGQTIRSVKMACSRRYGTKHKYRDNRTPEGFFSAYGIYDSTDWKYTDDDGYTSDAEGVYGPRFIRLSTRVSSSIGIHGTNSPWSPGHRVSHGCIRLHNTNIAWLVKYVQKGTPIIVNPSLEDDRINQEEDCDIPMFSLDGRKLRRLEPREKSDEEKTGEEKALEKKKETEKKEPEKKKTPDKKAADKKKATDKKASDKKTTDKKKTVDKKTTDKKKASDNKKTDKSKKKA